MARSTAGAILSALRLDEATGEPLYRQLYGALREAIARYLAGSRGVACDPSQVIVLSSSQQALDLAARVLVDPGDEVWIEEPGYDSEYRYAGRPVRALQGLDADGRVIYAGTFTKVLFPSLRIAYLVVPADLVRPFVVARAQVDGHAPTLTQAVVHDFLEEGCFGAHLRRMRSLYAERQEHLVTLLERHLGAELQARPDPAGMHLVAYLRTGDDDGALSRAARTEGVEAPPISRFYLGEPRRRGLVLGYAGFDRGRLAEGVARLRRAFESPVPESGPSG